MLKIFIYSLIPVYMLFAFDKNHTGDNIFQPSETFACMGNCMECHSLTKQEAKTILSRVGCSKILSLKPSKVPGLWQVEFLDNKGKKRNVFINFGKDFIIEGKVIEAK